MERFLNEEAVQKSRSDARFVMRVLYSLAGLSLALFILLCLLTRTGNAQSMLYLAMSCMVLGSLAVLALWMFAAEPARAEERHMAGLAGMEPETREGRFFLDRDSFRIPKSVRVRKVRLETKDEVLSLNLNEKLAGRMPSDGSLVRVETARKFITGMEVLEPGPEQAARPKPSRLKQSIRVLGRFFLPAAVTAMMAVLLTGFVFIRITDTVPEHKIVLYADCGLQNAPELAEKLEKALDGSVRMVKIHPFSYAMFDSVRLKQADLYLVPDSHREEYREWFRDDGGLLMFDPGSGLAVAEEYFIYAQEQSETEPYRLYTGSSSVHLEDGLARRAAELLLSMSGTAKEDTP